MCAFNPPQRTRILVADDEKVIADTLKLILTGAGYDVAVTYDGVDALEKALHWSPDLLLSDVFMPGMSGIDAAIKVCEQLPHCKVLLVSGQAALQDLRREIQSRCHSFDVLTKPIHPADLLARIEQMLQSGSR